jgi:DNA repair exonuclease SbcCD ATPase subunit
VLTADARRRAGVERRELERSRRQLEEQKRELDGRQAELERQEAALKKRYVTLTDLEKENALLKRDLQNIDVNLHKLELDRDRDRERQTQIEAKVQEMAGRHLKDNVKSIGSAINADNFVNCKHRLVKAIEQCRAIGFEIPESQETGLLNDLKAEFERAVKAQLEREEQARIKARLREEQQVQREIELELKRLERERQVVKAALEKALADAQQQHTQEVERLETRLAEAEAKIQRAVSQAQLTRAGHVYVISNIGSFGEKVYKIGMTRRLEPQDRVRELGDASVPFPFDVHMMVYSEDAPKLENALHLALHRGRLNKLKPRKEFYHADLDSIVQIVRENHGEVEYRADAEALEYRQSLVASDEDLKVVEEAWGKQDEDD